MRHLLVTPDGEHDRHKASPTASRASIAHPPGRTIRERHQARRGVRTKLAAPERRANPHSRTRSSGRWSTSNSNFGGAHSGLPARTVAPYRRIPTRKRSLRPSTIAPEHPKWNSQVFSLFCPYRLSCPTSDHLVPNRRKIRSNGSPSLPSDSLLADIGHDKFS